MASLLQARLTGLNRVAAGLQLRIVDLACTGRGADVVDDEAAGPAQRRQAGLWTIAASPASVRALDVRGGEFGQADDRRRKDAVAQVADRVALELQDVKARWHRCRAHRYTWGRIHENAC